MTMVERLFSVMMVVEVEPIAGREEEEERFVSVSLSRQRRQEVQA
jgi:hypothetical protein